MTQRLLTNIAPRTVYRLLLGGLAILLSSCPENPRSDTPSDAAASTSAVAPVASAERIEALVAAEHRRAAAEVTSADQQSRDVAVRRHAARALAHIGGDAARPGLLRALLDEDDDVVAWGAYGLGFWCKGHEAETVSALVASALAYASDPAKSTPRDGGTKTSALDPWFAISRAIGSCAAETSEPTLVAWLAGPRDRAVSAAYALGDVASIKMKLREETLVALLNLASGSAAAPPVPEALYPIGRLEYVPQTVIERIRDVATARLAEAGDARFFAVRALGRAGEPAVNELARVLSTPAVFSAAERAEAAQSLKRLKTPGQRALEQALSSLVPSDDPVALSALVSDDIGVLLSVLASIKPGSSSKALRDLAALPPPPNAPPTILRRISWLRCSAAKLVADNNYREPVLLGCDVTTATKDAAAKDPLPQASIVARAVVDVIGRSSIAGARHKAWMTYAESGELRAREDALQLIATHDEIENAAPVLAKALAEDKPGLIGIAAEVIAKQPQRASEPVATPRKKRGKKKSDQADKTSDAPPTVSSAVVNALLALLNRVQAQQDPEMIDTVIDAVGALALKQAEPRLNELCKSSYPTTREHAEKALGLISDTKPTCPPTAGEAPVELQAPIHAITTLTFETDVGTLTLRLDPSFAPVAVTRLVDLARAGYYNNMVVHRVVPGFVTQFGAPFGDGFGGPPDKPAIRCETSPLPFKPLRVGVALAGRDTGSSQFFVMHAQAPHLDGKYSLVGDATGPWAAFVDGDIIRGVKVDE